MRSIAVQILLMKDQHQTREMPIQVEHDQKGRGHQKDAYVTFIYQKAQFIHDPI